ncbi:hypothetical protein KC315_g7749 [Hortaea werneckii]|nr:hypothetical protein KC315_g7749 [Hortaea werneckii]
MPALSKWKIPDRRWIDFLRATRPPSTPSEDALPSSDGEGRRSIMFKKCADGTWRITHQGSDLTQDELRLDEPSDNTDVPNARRQSNERRQAPPTPRGRKRKRGGEEEASRAPSPPDELHQPCETPQSQVEVPATQPPTAVERQVAAWLQEQLPKTTAATRETMVARLLEIGGIEVAWEWKATIEQWRLDQTLTAPRETNPSEDGWEARAIRARVWLQERTDWDREFVRLWDCAQQWKVAGFLDQPKLRLMYARLYERYETLQAEKDMMGRGRQARWVAKETMFGWLYGSADRPKAKWNAFGRTLKYSRRWLEVARTLGYASLALFPRRLSSNWIEQTLVNDELSTWLEAVRRFHPEVVGIAERLLPVFSQATTGMRPPAPTLGIERWDGSRAGLQALGADWFTPADAIPQTPPLSSLERSEDEELWAGDLGETDWDALLGL